MLCAPQGCALWSNTGGTGIATLSHKVPRHAYAHTPCAPVCLPGQSCHTRDPCMSRYNFVCPVHLYAPGAPTCPPVPLHACLPPVPLYTPVPLYAPGAACLFTAGTPIYPGAPVCPWCPCMLVYPRYPCMHAPVPLYAPGAACLFTAGTPIYPGAPVCPWCPCMLVYPRYPCLPPVPLCACPGVPVCPRYPCMLQPCPALVHVRHAQRQGLAATCNTDVVGTRSTAVCCVYMR